MDDYKSYDVVYFNRWTNENVRTVIHARSHAEATAKAAQIIKGRLDKSWRVQKVSEAEEKENS